MRTFAVICLIMVGTSGCASGPWKSLRNVPLVGKSSKAAYVERLAAGRSFETERRWEEARAHYEGMVEDYPKRVHAYHRLGVVCDNLKRYGQAQQWYTKALEIDPEQAVVHNDLGYSYYLAGKLDDAVASIGRAIEIDDRDPRYRTNLGLTLGVQGDLGAAFEQFRLAGSEADAHFNMAFVHSMRGSFSEARICFRRALSVDPTHDTALRALASFDRAERDPDGWREEYEMARQGMNLVAYVEGMENEQPSAESATPSHLDGKFSPTSRSSGPTHGASPIAQAAATAAASQVRAAGEARKL